MATASVSVKYHAGKGVTVDGTWSVGGVNMTVVGHIPIPTIVVNGSPIKLVEAPVAKKNPNYSTSSTIVAQLGYSSISIPRRIYSDEEAAKVVAQVAVFPADKTDYSPEVSTETSSNQEGPNIDDD
jgi:hypothetical protein